MAPHSSVLAWRIPGTGEPGGLPAMGSQRVRQDWTDLAAAAAAVYSSLTFENFSKTVFQDIVEGFLISFIEETWFLAKEIMVNS